MIRSTTASGRELERPVDIARREGGVEGLHLLGVDAVPLEERRRHRGDVERGQDAAGTARDVGVGGDRAEQRVAHVERIGNAARSLCPDLKVMHGVAQGVV